jgi:serine/threonine-protein kinase
MGEIFLRRYEVEHDVGQGGMATVYRGIDHVLNRPVAIKVLHTHLLQKVEARARFAREARVIAKLRHPNIVEVYDFSGEDSDRAFIVAEYVDGMSLAEYLLRHGPLLPEIAALVTASVAGALDHAHGRGVVHRDIKPENIMVRKDGVLKLMDFGIAHVMDTEQLTMTGTVIGSPAHMSPEQVDGKALDARTDIFSLGTLFYLIASGEYPFQADSPAGLMRAVVEARVPDIRSRRPEFPDDLWAVLQKMMARDAANRYESAAEITTAIESITNALGLGPIQVELPACFADPEGYAASTRKRLSQARLVRAREHLDKGRQALALREASVVLALDPDNDDALAVLKRARMLARRYRRIRTSAAVVAGLFVAAGVAMGGVFWWASRAVPLPAEGVEHEVSLIEAREAPEATLDLSPRRDLALLPDEQSTVPRGTQSARNGASPGRDATLKRQLMPVSIQANPPAVRIEVNGRFVGEGKVEGLMLPPGTHQVRLSHPSCEQCREVVRAFELDPARPLQGPLRLSIGYLDARLLVKGPAGARVFLNRESRPRGRTNQELSIPMAQPGEVAAVVRIEVEGEEPRTLRVVLEPGKATSAAVP